MSPSRRRFLATLGTLGAASLAGCGSILADPHQTLGCVAVSNDHSEPHTVRLRIDRNGERVHESIRDRAPDGDDDSMAAIPADWPLDGRFVIRSRLDDGAWTEIPVDELTAPNGADCLDVELRVRVTAERGDGSTSEPRLATLASDCGGVFCDDGTPDPN